MSSGDKNVSFRGIIWTKKIFFRQSDICPFLTKGEIVYKNPLKRSVLKSQFQNLRNLDEKDKFFHTIHTKTTYNSRGNKNRLNTSCILPSFSQNISQFLPSEFFQEI